MPVLRTLLLWKNGAHGPLRLHKTLFCADRNSFGKQHRHFFTFKKWHLGQFSDDIADALDYVRCYERIRAVVEGERFHLLEAIAEHVADSLLEEPRAQLARVRVGKEPPLPGQIRRCAVVIERARTVP